MDADERGHPKINQNWMLANVSIQKKSENGCWQMWASKNKSKLDAGEREHPKKNSGKDAATRRHPFRFYLYALFINRKSKMVMAAIASTIGTARGNTHGSWRPRAFRTVSFPSLSTVSCSRRRVATDLKATRK